MFNMAMGGGGAHTALTNQEGASNSSQAYNASIGYGPWIMANGSYSKASGQALVTGSGLVPVPVPPPALPPGVVSLYRRRELFFSLSSAPVKKLLISASYSKSDQQYDGHSVRLRPPTPTANSIRSFNTNIRKLNFTSGYARLEQGFSHRVSKPEMISSYYMGISRWFNFF